MKKSCKFGYVWEQICPSEQKGCLKGMFLAAWDQSEAKRGFLHGPKDRRLTTTIENVLSIVGARDFLFKENSLV
jgi:hypothetical protein